MESILSMSSIYRIVRWHVKQALHFNFFIQKNSFSAVRITIEKDGSLTHWHNGGTYGSSSIASFNRAHGVGLIILSNYGTNLLSHLPLLGAGKLNVDKLAKLLNKAILS